MSEQKDAFIRKLQGDREAEVIFHGGCHGCLTQHADGIDNCRNCQYFDADWSLPDLSRRILTHSEIERNRIKQKYGMI